LNVKAAGTTVVGGIVVVVLVVVLVVVVVVDNSSARSTSCSGVNMPSVTVTGVETILGVSDEP
jgi:hypothetical protein